MKNLIINQDFDFGKKCKRKKAIEKRLINKIFILLIMNKYLKLG